MSRAPIVALSCLAVLVMVSAIPLGSQEVPYGHYHPELNARHLWDDPFIAHARLPALDPHGDVLVVVAPRIPYTPQEAQAVRDFLHAGGHVLVADDVGTARALLKDINAGPVLSGVRVATPVQDEVSGQPFLYPTGALSGPASPWPSPTIVDGPGAPLLVSSPLAWRDQDGDGRPGLTEPHGEWAFARSTTVGAGRLVVLGSPDLLLHPEWGPALAAHAAGERRPVLDEAHLAPDAVRLAPWLAGASSTLVGLLVTGWLLGVVALSVRLRLHRTRRHRRTPGLDPVDRQLLEELA